jgi:sterol 3beta-glucosyltransferase
MKIAFCTIGTRGDVQPFVALALKLTELGHSITLAAPPNHESFVKGFGLEFHPIGIDTQKFMEEFQTGKNMTNIMVKMDEMWTRNNRNSWELCQKWRPDVIIFHQAISLGCSIAEKLDIPAIEVSFAPWNPTGAFPVYMDAALCMEDPDSDPYFKYYMTHTPMHSGAAWWHSCGWANGLREEMGLNSLPIFGYWYTKRFFNNVPMVFAWSPAVLPLPEDWSKDDHHVVGNWFLPEPEYQPSKELKDFLANGEAPIYVGFGSMYSGDNDRISKLIIDVIINANQRLILSSGWCNLSNENTPDHVLVVGNVPHSWLFPRMKAIVHHGGAGSTAAGVRAGVPSIIVSHISDQFFWGSRLYKLGVGTAPIEVDKLTTENFSKAIRTVVQDDVMRQKAKELGERVRVEDGIQNFIQVLDNEMKKSGGKWQGREQPPQEWWSIVTHSVKNEETGEIKEEKVTDPAAYWKMVELQRNMGQKKQALVFAKEALDIENKLGNTPTVDQIRQTEQLLNDVCHENQGIENVKEIKDMKQLVEQVKQQVN